jgi:hypothetical protein
LASPVADNQPSSPGGGQSNAGAAALAAVN